VTSLDVARAFAASLLLLLAALVVPLVRYTNRNRRGVRMTVLNAPAVDLTAPTGAELPAPSVEPTRPPEPSHPIRPDNGPRLPERVVVDCRWYGSIFDGWCAPPSNKRWMRVRGAAWRGGMHAAMGHEGQDAVGAAWNPATGTLFLAVADGLGSLPHSGAVAYEAVNAALHLCTTRADGRQFRDVGTRLFEAVTAGLRRSFGPQVADEGGTTLVVAEVTPDDRGASITVHGVGDSEAWVLEHDRWQSLHHERHERDGDFERDDNVTRDLPSDPRPRTGHGRLGRGGLLVLATDGFAERIGEGTAGSARLVEQLRWPLPALDLARTVVGVDDEYSDDRGVVAVWVD
jgi:serine/threonine protein phosphatase PrpC